MFTISQSGAELDKLMKMQPEEWNIAARAKHIDSQKRLLLGVLSSGLPKLANKNQVQHFIEDKPNKLWTITELMSLTGATKGSVQNQLAQLASRGLVIKIEKVKAVGYVSGDSMAH